MTTQGYQPQINLTAIEPDRKEKYRLGGLVLLAAIGGVALVFGYFHWFGNVQPASENSATASEAAAEKSGMHVSSRRVGPKHSTDKESQPTSDAELTLGPGIIQSAIRSPLAVEVISSDGHHQILDTRNDSVYLPSNQGAAEPGNVMASGQGNIVAADPVIAKQQTLEGAVVLLATIDKEGNIQKLQPVSGPEILFAAAREAVKQWRFKPYYAAGAPVDSETQITVKFAISAH